MNPDERIIGYMKERNDHARTVACAVAVQLFALAVYFCMYALIAGRVFLSLSEDTGNVIMISVSAAIAIFIIVLNILTVIRGKKVYINRPDSIALRDGADVVRIAYSTARPVLIYKITYSLVILATGGLVYITFVSFMEDQILAGLYGKIVVCIAGAVAFLIMWPCIDRIACYRSLLNETHELYYDEKPDNALKYIAAFTVPAVICLWYILRYFGTYQGIAWIVFPVAALFAFAIAFLIKVFDSGRDI